MTQEEREKQFRQQLKRNEESIKQLLLGDDEYMHLKEFYANHFDEILEILKYQSSRMSIEDIMAIEPSVFVGGNYEFLFMMQVNDAIKDGVIKAEDFE